MSVRILTLTHCTKIVVSKMSDQGENNLNDLIYYTFYTFTSTHSSTQMSTIVEATSRTHRDSSCSNRVELPLTRSNGAPSKTMQ